MVAAAQLSAPGVGFEFGDARPRGVPRIRTDITGFVGFAERGPLHAPVRVESWQQYEAVFGGFGSPGFLPYAIRIFFENGGRTAYVVRVAVPERARTATAELPTTSSFPGLGVRLWAVSPGRWGNDVGVEVHPGGRGRATLIVRDRLTSWRVAGITTDPDDERYVGRVLAAVCVRCGRNVPRPPGATGADTGAQQCSCPAPEIARPEFPIRAVPLADHSLASPLRPGAVGLDGGSDGVAQCSVAHLTGATIRQADGSPLGLAALTDVDPVAMIAIPDSVPFPLERAPERMPPDPTKRGCEDLDETVVADPPSAPPSAAAVERPPQWNLDDSRRMANAAARFCELRQDCVALIDPATRFEDEADIEAYRDALDESSYAALYWPWLLVRAARPAGVGEPATARWIAAPPSGAIAGLTASLDSAVGPYRTPAGNPVRAAAAVVHPVGEEEHARLNHIGVNVLTARAQRGVVLEGARSLSRSRPLRHFNVRRTLLAIREMVDEATQWAVHEPNGARLWADLGDQVRLMMGDLWRRGWLSGATADEAFDVRCDATTNSAEHLEMGMVVAEIRLRIPPPMEWIIVRIGRSMSRVELLEIESG